MTQPQAAPPESLFDEIAKLLRKPAGAFLSKNGTPAEPEPER